jgi:hypothetical protein
MLLQKQPAGRAVDIALKRNPDGPPTAVGGVGNHDRLNRFSAVLPPNLDLAGGVNGPGKLMTTY